MAAEFEAEIERRLGRPFSEIQAQLEEMFDQEWDDVVVVIETSSLKTQRSFPDVVVDLIERSERKVPVQSKVKRGVIRWIGKPWRERENPWERFKDKVPPVPPPARNDPNAPDLDEWTPIQPDAD
jgi:hypothetical protein